MERLAALVAIGACVYAALLAALWWGQERLIFQPEVLSADHRFGVDADVHERWVDVPGARLHALHLRVPEPRGVVFYLHGNGGSLAGWFADVDLYRRARFDLFMLDYRGYGKSSGRIASEAQLHADVRAAWDAVAPAYAGKARVLLGRSLGSALAAQLAAQVRPELTILVSPYSSLRVLAAQHFPWVPTALLLRYRLDTAAALAALGTPLMLVHGVNDTLIPPAHSETLSRARPDARLHIVPGAGHNDLQEFEAYRAALRGALAAAGPPQGGASPSGGRRAQ